MKNNYIHTPEGVRDLLPRDCLIKDEIIRRLKKEFSAYNYKPVESPLFEFEDIFTRISKKAPRELYKLIDREGQTIALRADMTPPIARIAASFFNQDPPPYRLYYIGNIYKSNDGYKGKLIETSQAGLELLGSDSAEADAELIALLIHSLKAMGLSRFKVDIGENKFIEGILEEAGLDNPRIKAVQDMLVHKDFIGVEELLKEVRISKQVKELMLNIPLLVGQREVLEKLSGMTQSPKALSALKRLKEIESILSEQDLSSFISFDLSMMNQLNYYTGIVFRAYTYDVGFSVADGGRYDGLVSEFGRELPAVGFGIKIFDIMDALSRQQIQVLAPVKQTLIAYFPQGRKNALLAAGALRKTGVNVEMSLVSGEISQAINFARSKQMGGVLYFGEDDKVTAVDMDSGEESTMALSQLLGEGGMAG